MKYRIQEASFYLPRNEFLDRTINILAFGNPQKPFSVVVTRDHLDKFPDVTALLKEQIHQLSHKEKKFAEHEFGEFSIAQSQLNLDEDVGRGAEASVSYLRQGHNVHQRIALITLPKRLVLAINGTFTEKWLDTMLSDWKKLITNIELH